jgi:hypothetical protein
MDRFRLSIIALVLALTITLVILDNVVMCRRILFCASPVVSFPDGVNLVQNGGFEADGLQPNRQGYMSFPVGSPALPNWEVTGATGQEVAWLLDTNVFRVTTLQGHQFLDLTGLNDISKNGFFASVRQTFPTKGGRTYHVSLVIGWFNPTFPGPVQALVYLFDEASSQLLKFETCGPFSSTTMGSQWTACSTSFVAPGNAITIIIRGQEIKGPGLTKYIGLDAVDVECVAPFGDHSLCT